jgi:hypothetical protein
VLRRKVTPEDIFRLLIAPRRVTSVTLGMPARRERRIEAHQINALRGAGAGTDEAA